MTLRRRSDLTLLSVAFVASRVVIDYLVPFGYETLDYYMQYLDPAVLRNDLTRGLLHLHSQPPLFNLGLGLFLKTVPLGAQRATMAGLYAGMGLVIVLGTYVLMRRLGIRRSTAFWFSLALEFFPSMVIAERWLFYSYPLATAMILSVLALERSMATGAFGWFAAFLAIVACIVLTRGFFHLLFWMIPIVVGTLASTGRQNPRRFWARVALSLVFLLLAGTVYVRNAFFYGAFTSSTFQGMNLAGMTRFVESDTVRRLVAEGRVTSLALIPRFSEPEVYFKYYGWVPRTGLDLLDSPTKSTGAINWNNPVYARAAKEYEANTLRIIEAEPRAYLKAVLNEVYIFFGFTPYRYFDSPLVKIRRDARAQEAWDILSRRLVPLIFALGFVGIVYSVSHWAIRGLRGPAGEDHTPVLCVYIVWNLLYTFAVASLVELGEGCFMRIPVDPLLCVGLALVFQPTGGPTGSKPVQRLFQSPPRPDPLNHPR